MSAAAKPGDPRDAGDFPSQPTFHPSQTCVQRLWVRPHAPPPAHTGFTYSSSPLEHFGETPTFLLLFGGTSTAPEPETPVRHLRLPLAACAPKLSQHLNQQRGRGSLTDPSALGTAVFGVSFLQQLPQQMPETSRCPNGTKCFHNKTGRHKNNLVSAFPQKRRNRCRFPSRARTHSPGRLEPAGEESDGERCWETAPGGPHPLHLPEEAHRAPAGPRGRREARAPPGPAADPGEKAAGNLGPEEGKDAALREVLAQSGEHPP